MKAWVALLLWLAALASSPVAVGEEHTQAPTTLKIVGRFSLPADEPVADLRWAGPDSIYLAYQRLGVYEVELSEGLPERRRVFPPAELVGFPNIIHIAVDDGRVVATPGGHHPAWRQLDAPLLQYETVQDPDTGGHLDIDLRGDELLLIGRPNRRLMKEHPGGWLWRAELSDGLGDWELLAESPELAAKPDMLVHERHYAVGSVRFLPKGGFAAVPSIVPGVLLFSSSGKLKRTWTPAELWPERTERHWDGKGDVPQEKFTAFLAVERLIDELLILDDDPAIVIREPGKKGRWRLGVLGAEVRWYDVPAASFSSVARLRGDGDRRGRIALIGVPRELFDEARVSKNELLILELPEPKTPE